jgi:hypothetical protein
MTRSLDREIAMRVSVYRRRVVKGLMRQDIATLEIDIMRDIRNLILGLKRAGYTDDATLKWMQVGKSWREELEEAQAPRQRNFIQGLDD